MMNQPRPTRPGWALTESISHLTQGSMVSAHGVLKHDERVK